MLKDENIVLNSDGRRFRPRIVGILQQFGDDVPGTLNLAKELMPRPG
jgi:hypothetical protein